MHSIVKRFAGKKLGGGWGVMNIPGFANPGFCSREGMVSRWMSCWQGLGATELKHEAQGSRYPRRQDEDWKQQTMGLHICRRKVAKVGAETRLGGHEQ